MKFNIFILVIMAAILLQSCYLTRYSYVGNILDDAIGKNKNQILRIYGVPDRTLDDGKGGTILIYENVSQTTISSSSAYGQGSSQSRGSVTYGYGNIYGSSNTNSSARVNASGISQTYTTKIYRNIYLNSENIVYDFQTNFGGKYESYSCLDKGITWLTCILFLNIFSPAVAIPVIYNAKIKGKLCN